MTDAETIAANEHAIAAAHAPLDLSVIERFYHPDFVVLQPDGTIETKTDVVDSYRRGERHWDVAAVDHLEVRVSGNTGVAIGRWRARGRNRGVGFDYAARFLSVWTRTEAGWLNLAYQANEVAIEP